VARHSVSIFEYIIFQLALFVLYLDCIMRKFLKEVGVSEEAGTGGGGAKKKSKKGFWCRLVMLFDKIVFSPGFFVIITVFLTFYICTKSKQFVHGNEPKQDATAVVEKKND